MNTPNNKEISEALVCSWENDGRDGAETRLVQAIKEALDHKDGEWQKALQKLGIFIA